MARGTGTPVHILYDIGSEMFVLTSYSLLFLNAIAGDICVVYRAHHE